MGHVRLRQAGHEIVLLGLLFAVYSGGRLLGSHRIGGAYRAGAAIWNFERDIDLPDERTLQALILPFHLLVEFANSYYKYVHFPLTAGVLVWLFFHSPAHYRWMRTALVAASAVAMVIYIALPVAPPRLMNGLMSGLTAGVATSHGGTVRIGMIDTGIAYGQSVYGVPGARSISNQFASMPSLHVGWALLVAVVMIHASRSRFRWLWVLHPVITTLVVIVTANHYWVDAFAGAALVLTALLAAHPVLTAGVSDVVQPWSRPAVAAALSRTCCPGRN